MARAPPLSYAVGLGRFRAMPLAPLNRVRPHTLLTRWQFPKKRRRLQHGGASFFRTRLISVTLTARSPSRLLHAVAQDKMRVLLR